MVREASGATAYGVMRKRDGTRKESRNLERGSSEEEERGAGGVGGSEEMGSERLWTCRVSNETRRSWAHKLSILDSGRPKISEKGRIKCNITR